MSLIYKDANFFFPKPGAKELACQKCGRGFTPVRPHLLSKAKFCSAKCWYARNEGKEKQKRVSTFKNKRTTNSCAHCGAGFQVWPSQRLRQRFCTPLCHAKSLNAWLTLSCVACKVEFTRRRSTRTNSRTFCSLTCAWAFNRGEASALYRGNRRNDRGPDWKQQSKLARERDANVCCYCGQKERRRKTISVDHIVPYRLAKLDEFASANDLRNLASLCDSCHASKTQAEVKILRGDVIGFVAWMNPRLGLERTRTALNLFALSGRREDR